MSDPRKDYLKAQPVVQKIVAEAVRKENRRCQDVLEEMAHEERQREEMALRAGARAIRTDR